MKKQLRQSPNDMYRARVEKVKPFLPKNFREIIFEKFPEYNTSSNSNLIMNVLAGRSSDVRLTEILEQIALKTPEPTNQTTIFDAIKEGRKGGRK